MNAGAGFLQHCALASLLQAPLPSLAANAPAFPLRSAPLQLCSGLACTCRGPGPAL